MATNATYKIWNGSTWVEYHFKTNVDQVQMTTGTGWKKFVSAKVKVNGVSFAEGSETGSAQVTITGANINNGVPTDKANFTAGAKISDTLIALDAAIEEAKRTVPSNVLTYGQNGSFQNQYEVLHQLESFVEENYFGSDVGFIRIKASNNNDIFFELDTTSYVPTSRTINGKSLGSNVTLTASDIGYSNAAFILANDVATYLDTLTNVVQGKQNSYACALSGTATGSINSDFNTQNDTVTITATFTIVIGGVTSNKCIKLTDGTTKDIANLKVGDNVFLTDPNVPDRWVSEVNIPANSGTGTIKFTKLETQKVDLSNYATKGTTLAHYGITDAKIANGTITLGGNSITPLTSHQDISGKAPNNHASSATTYGIGTGTNYGHVKLATGDMKNASHEDGIACSKNHTHSQYLTSHQSLNEYPKIFVQNAQPTASKSGDLWIQIPQA